MTLSTHTSYAAQSRALTSRRRSRAAESVLLTFAPLRRRKTITSLRFGTIHPGAKFTSESLSPVGPHFHKIANTTDPHDGAADQSRQS